MTFLEPEHAYHAYDTLTAIVMIKENLDEQSCLRIFDEEGNNWKASFYFTTPANEFELEKVQSRWYLPPSYTQFLAVSNGAMLYKDAQYGQWGFHVYGTEELLTKNEQWHTVYGSMPASYLVFAESLGDADFLILKTHHSEETNECAVIASDVGYEVNTWPTIAHSFVEWLNRLVRSQGTKYWEGEELH